MEMHFINRGFVYYLGKIYASRVLPPQFTTYCVFYPQGRVHMHFATNKRSSIKSTEVNVRQKSLIFHSGPLFGYVEFK
jgi:hypothetical protein